MNILIAHGIERRSTAGYKKPFNEDFFEDIDCEEKAYWVGFMMADVNSIINYIYEDATIYLNRKYNACYQVYVNIERATSK